MNIVGRNKPIKQHELTTYEDIFTLSLDPYSIIAIQIKETMHI